MIPDIRLGVNIDHVATLRRQRDTPYPDILQAAKAVIAGGADQITIHLREDRRHILDEDVARLRANISVHMNLEMAATQEMGRIALETNPHAICLVPEKREERTTEGGLDLSSRERTGLLETISREAAARGIVVSHFIEPDPRDLARSAALGATAVELHTGALCLAHQRGDMHTWERELIRLKEAVKAGQELGLAVHAGHGIDYEIAPKLAPIEGILEYNIGHALVCEALFCGLEAATRRMKQLLTRSPG